MVVPITGGPRTELTLGTKEVDKYIVGLQQSKLKRSFINPDYNHLDASSGILWGFGNPDYNNLDINPDYNNFYFSSYIKGLRFTDISIYVPLLSRSKTTALGFLMITNIPY